jgi:hypothetical protein
MKNYFFMCIIVLFAGLLSYMAFAADEVPGIEEQKKLYDFDNWPNKNCSLISKIDLLNENISSFDQALKKEIIGGWSSFEGMNGNMVIYYNYRWTIYYEWDVQIRIVVANSGEDAHEYYLKRAISRSGQAPLKDSTAVAGDISFNRGHDFIRNNIVIEIISEGKIDEEVEQIARQIDTLINNQSKISPASHYKPIISKINFIKVNEGIRMAIIEPIVSDPLGGSIDSKVFYRNGYENFFIKNSVWYYSLNQSGSSVLPILFVNDKGFNTLVKLNISATETDIFSNLRSE